MATFSASTSVGDVTTGKRFRLLSDSQFFSYDTNGSPSPSGQVITFSEHVSNLGFNNQVIYSTSPAVTLGGTAGARTLSLASFGSNDKVVVTASATDGTATTLDDLVDQVTIHRLRAGDSAYHVFQSNEAHTVVADSEGTVNLFSGSGTDISVFYGSERINLQAVHNVGLSADEFRIRLVKQSGTLTLNDSNDLITPSYGDFGAILLDHTINDIAALTEDNGTRTFEVEVSGPIGTTSQKFEIVQSFSKSKKGKDPFAGFLTNEVETVAATSTGDAGSFSVGGEFVVFQGTEDITSSGGVVFSVESSTGVVGATIGTNGVYSVTGFSSTTTEAGGSVSFKATIGSVSISKIFSISKSIAGINGSRLLKLTTSRHSFEFEDSNPTTTATGVASLSVELLNFQDNSSITSWTATAFTAAGVATDITLLTSKFDSIFPQSLSATLKAFAFETNAQEITRVSVTATKTVSSETLPGETDTLSDTITFFKVREGDKVNVTKSGNTLTLSSSNGVTQSILDGATWHTGAGAPPNSLGENGDYYLRTSDESVYLKNEGSWGVLINTLRGGNGLNADVLNFVFQDAVSKPSVPAVSAGVPSGWVDSVPAIVTNTLWSTLGRQTSGTGNFSWGQIAQVTGDDGVPGADGAIARGPGIDAVPAYSNADYNTITYDESEGALVLQSDTDFSIGMAYPAFNVESGNTVEFSVTYKASAAAGTGFYVRVYEYDSDLPSGKVAVSNSASNPVVQEDTRTGPISPLVENQAITTSYQTKAFTYTPTSTARWASIVILNWTGIGNNSLFIKPVNTSIRGYDGVNGDLLNFIFRESVTEPARPLDSAGIPTGWSDSSPPPSTLSYTLWTCLGTKIGSTGDYSWGEVIQLTGQDGQPGQPGQPGDRGAGRYSKEISVSYAPEIGSDAFNQHATQLVVDVTGSNPIAGDTVTIAYNDSSAPFTILVGSFAGSVTAITVSSTAGFAEKGRLTIGSNTGFNYTSRSSSQFFGPTQTLENTITSGSVVTSNSKTITRNAIHDGTGLASNDWQAFALSLDGSLLVNGTVVSDAIVAGAISSEKLSATALFGKYARFSSEEGVVLDSYAHLTAIVVADGASGVGAQVGLYGQGSLHGVVGEAETGGSWSCVGWGQTNDTVGVLGTSTSKYAVQAVNYSAGIEAIVGLNQGGGTGVRGASQNHAVNGQTSHPAGMWGFATNQKVYAELGYSPFTGSHLCFGDATLAVGDIVSTSFSQVASIDNAFISVERCTTAKDKKAIGVVSSVSAVALTSLAVDFCEITYVDEGEVEIDILSKGTKPKLTEKREIKEEYLVLIGSDSLIEINSLGEGGISVCGEGGDLEAGDYICSSSIPGKGMKQEDDLMRNYTIAKCLSDIVFTSPEEVRMVPVTYHCG